MDALPARFSPLVALVCAALAVALPACGDDSESASDRSDAPTETSGGGSGSAAGPSLETVLSCLQDAGLDAEDQSSNTSGETIGIDYPSGRTVISFEESEEDADLTESVQPDPTAETFREGLIVVSMPGSPDAAGDRAAIETCIAG